MFGLILKHANLLGSHEAAGDFGKMETAGNSFPIHMKNPCLSHPFGEKLEQVKIKFWFDFF